MFSEKHPSSELHSTELRFQSLSIVKNHSRIELFWIWTERTFTYSRTRISRISIMSNNLRSRTIFMPHVMDIYKKSFDKSDNRLYRSNSPTRMHPTCASCTVFRSLFESRITVDIGGRSGRFPSHPVGQIWTLSAHDSLFSSLTKQRRN